MVNVGEYDVAKSTLALQNSRFDPNVLPTCPFSAEYTADDVGGWLLPDALFHHSMEGFAHLLVQFLHCIVKDFRT